MLLEPCILVSVGYAKGPAIRLIAPSAGPFVPRSQLGFCAVNLQGLFEPGLLLLAVRRRQGLLVLGHGLVVFPPFGSDRFGDLRVAAGEACDEVVVEFHYFLRFGARRVGVGSRRGGRCRC